MVLDVVDEEVTVVDEELVIEVVVVGVLDTMADDCELEVDEEVDVTGGTDEETEDELVTTVGVEVELIGETEVKKFSASVGK